MSRSGQFSSVASRRPLQRLRAVAVVFGALLALSVTLPSLAGASHFWGGGGSSGFDIPSFVVTPSTTQAGGHPNLTIAFNRSGPSTADLRDVVLDLPTGLIGNPEAVSTKCPLATFNADRCTSVSSAGSVTVVANALGLSIPISGTVYVLEPGASDAGTLGLFLRSPLPGVIPNIRAVDAITIRTSSDYGLRNEILRLPRDIKALGLTVGITIESIKLTLKGKLSNGAFFLTNPTSCAVATSKLKAVSYGGVEVNKQSSFTPTGCDVVPFAPTLSVVPNSTVTNAGTGVMVAVGVPGGEDPIRQSHVKSVDIQFAPGIKPNLIGLGSVDECSDAALAADACPAGSDVGAVSVAVPPLGAPLVGDVYIVSPGANLVGLGLVVRGPRGIKVALRGSVNVDGSNRLLASFADLPQIPFTALDLSLTTALLKNPVACGTITSDSVFTGHSGAVANPTSSYTVTGC